MDGISKLPEESAEEWRKRYHREKMRRRRLASKDPSAPRKLRGKNKAPGKHGDLTTEEWQALQPMPGETPEEHKRRYAREIMRRWRAKNPEKEAARRRSNYPAIREQEIERHKKWKLDNPERFQASQKKYFENNKDARLAKLKEWARNNPERMREVNRKWFESHPGVNSANAAKARARVVRGTPPWMWSRHGAEIEAVYAEAAKMTRRTGIPHEVDHIEPLAGKDICGLHVPWNLRVITAEENRQKRNKRITEPEKEQSA